MEGFTSDIEKIVKPAAASYFSEMNSNMELINTSRLSEELMNQPPLSSQFLNYFSSADPNFLNNAAHHQSHYSNEQPEFHFQQNGALALCQTPWPSPVCGDQGGTTDTTTTDKNNNSKKGKKRKRKNNNNEEEEEEEAEKPKEVIHVRAKRGQATDSHSLAERVRRERINDKLKVLQDLVPGCYKTMGMAVMLDVIINYVRSLQNQIEFLSMKLSAASMFYDFNSPEAEAIEVLQRTAASPFDVNVTERMAKEVLHEGIMLPRPHSTLPPF